MRKVYITRYSAIGDHIHASHLPRLLKEKLGYDWVTFEYNIKGIPVYSHNPFIDEHIVYDPSVYPIRDYPVSFLEKRKQYIKETGNFEKVIDLRRSIEYGYIAMEDQNEYYLSSNWRREHFGKHNYYDQTLVWAGLEKYVGTKGELYFTEEQESFVKDFYKQYKDNFVIICNLSGSSKHKLFYNAEEIIKEFLRRHKDAVCITMGDNNCKKHLEFSGERIINKAGKYPFKQSMLIAKYSGMVIGCESGLMVASTLLGAPTIQLMTAASIKNHGGDFKNDFSLQSPVECSPCHCGPYEYIGCRKFDHLGLKYPICIKFDINTILARMEEVYDSQRKSQKTKTPEMSAL